MEYGEATEDCYASWQQYAAPMAGLCNGISGRLRAALYGCPYSHGGQINTHGTAERTYSHVRSTEFRVGSTAYGIRQTTRKNTKEAGAAVPYL